MTDWISEIKHAKKSCLVDKNLKKIHYDFENKEMVEEYNMDTGVLTRRAWKCKQSLRGKDQWEVEIGDPEPTYATDERLISESSNQPIVSRRNTRLNLEWRIRNLPYSMDTYSVTVIPEERCLIVRTTNKKYYKKLVIPELNRLNLELEQSSVSFSHKFNTLIITYKKPKELVNFEKYVLEEVQSIQPKSHGDMDCRPS
ncbi:protein DPCD [Leptinotarsa decemlineata]|uniref:protein DPCD n=1 Tax=Leptinotarsa decemlineata TaxID=7539 RepID=UPI003D30C109